MSPRVRRLSSRAVILVAALAAGAGCAHRTQFTTEPEGALISVDGAPLGQAPAVFESRSGIPRTYFLKIEAEGYRKVETRLESEYRADLSLLLLIPGIVPYFFSARLPDVKNFVLVPEGGFPAPAPTPPPAVAPTPPPAGVTPPPAGVTPPPVDTTPPPVDTTPPPVDTTPPPTGNPLGGGPPGGSS